VPFLRALRARQSAREFSGPPVRAATVRRVLDLARRAPSEFAIQPWRVLVCHQTRDRRRLRTCCLDQAQVEAAGVAFVVFASTRDLRILGAAAARRRRAAGRLTAQQAREHAALARRFYGADPARTRRSALRNGVIFAHQLLLAGLALGMDGFWLAGVDERALRAAFRVPADCVFAGVIGLGWGGVRLPPLRGRPLSDLVLPGRPRGHRHRTGARRHLTRRQRPR
jgi:nitroreductase